MHVVIRTYTGQGASELFEVLEQRKQDVEAVLSSVSGFVSYVGFRTPDGGATVTVCEDKTGTDESSRRAAEWVRDNVRAAVDPPTVTEGAAFLRF